MNSEEDKELLQYRYLTATVVKDLKESIVKLLESQTEMGKSIAQLTEAFKMVDRLDARLIRLEELDRSRDKEQDQKISEVRAYMYKLTGALMVAGAVVDIAARRFL